MFCAVFCSFANFPKAAAGEKRAEKIKIDFSFAGYGAGESLPDVAAVWRVRPTGGVDTKLLQAGLDKLSEKPVNSDGFCGALLASEKTKVKGQLKLNSSGVVLCGNADVNNPTEINAAGISRRTLMNIGNENASIAGAKIAISDDVETGRRVLRVENAAGFKIGDRVEITRLSTKEWIATIGMDKAEGAFADQRIH